MTSEKRISNGTLGSGLVFAVLSLFLGWIVVSIASHHGGGGDPAGRAIEDAFDGLFINLLYLLIGVFALIAAIGGDMPKAGRAAILVLVPCAYATTWTAYMLLARRGVPPGHWPIVIVAGAPLLIVAYGLWALIGPLRAAVPPRLAGGVILGALALLCLGIVPLSAVRDTANAREADRVADWQQKLAAMPDIAPLRQWLPFLNSRVDDVEQAAREKISTLESRQTDAEAMLERDEFPFRDLSEFDLDPTPALCEKAQASLSRRAAAIPSPEPKPSFAQIAREVDGATRAIDWLVSLDCASDRQSLEWEKVARSYGASDTDVADLVQARDPKQLGYRLDFPPRAWMLTSKTPLYAWLSFASRGPDGISPQAPELLQGARSLDHRTADAVAWLNGSGQASFWMLTHFLPELDLEPTPQLCTAALKAISQDFAEIYPPTADHPKPYSELGQRLGLANPLEALQWLAGHGCPAEPELTAAVTLVAAYQPAPEREAMLESLAKLHKQN